MKCSKCDEGWPCDGGVTHYYEPDDGDVGGDFAVVSCGDERELPHHKIKLTRKPEEVTCRRCRRLEGFPTRSSGS